MPMFSYQLHLVGWWFILSAVRPAPDILDILTTRPGVVNCHSGDNAELNWNIDPQSLSQVNQIMWYFATSGNALSGWDPDNGLITYSPYHNRISIRNDSNAGITMRNVAVSDAGRYMVQIGGFGIRDEAILNVYTDKDLIPRLYINNVEKEFGSHPEIEGPLVYATVTTRVDVPTSFTLKVADHISQTCSNQSTCSALVDFNTIKIYDVKLEVLMQCSICHVQKYELFIKGRKPIPDLKPKLFVDNTEIQLGSSLNVVDKTLVHVTASANTDIPTTFLFKVTDQHDKECTNQFVCTIVINFCTTNVTHIRVQTQMVCDICETQTYNVFISRTGSTKECIRETIHAGVSTSWKVAVFCLIGVCFCVAIVTMIVLLVL